eukprot:gene32093-39639_t
MVSNAPQLPLKTVQNLNLEAYLGRWFMMFASQVPLNTYLKNAVCVIDDHKHLIGGLNGDNKPIEAEFTMLVSFNQNTPTGPMQRITAVATNDNFSAEPGQFQTHFDVGPPVITTHYILAVGDIEPPWPGDRSHIGTGDSQDTSQPEGVGRGGLRGELATKKHGEGDHRHHKNHTHDHHPHKPKPKPPLPKEELPPKPKNEPKEEPKHPPLGPKEKVPPPPPSPPKSSPVKAPIRSPVTSPVTKPVTTPTKSGGSKTTLDCPSMSVVPPLGVFSARLAIPNKYPWAIVSDEQGRNLFILARDVAEFRAKYQSVVLQRVRELGFTAE